MNLLVHNRYISTTDLSLEACAIRFGLLMAEFTFALGELPLGILYKERITKITESGKINMLLQSAYPEVDLNAIRQAAAELKYLRGKKHKVQHEIVFMKRTEKFIEQVFEAHLDTLVTSLTKFGLSSLSPLNENEHSGLRLWHIDAQKGEAFPKQELSSLLACQFNEDTIDGSDVLMLVGPVAKAIHQQVEMTQLCDLPNLNTLLPNQLLAARERLASYREELNKLIPLMQPTGNGTHYCTGTWNLDGLKKFAVRLQEEVGKVPELEWATDLQKEVRSMAHAGVMPTPALWQLLRDNDLIQDDTWEVLSNRMASGDHRAQTSFMTMTAPANLTSDRYFSEEESLKHKRKTLDID